MTSCGGDEAASGEPRPLQVRCYEVRVDLADVITLEELRYDLAANPFHWMLEFKPRLTQNASGRVTIDLTVPGRDVWTAVLTTMATLRQSGYEMHELHVVTQESRDQQAAA